MFACGATQLRLSLSLARTHGSWAELTHGLEHARATVCYSMHAPCADTMPHMLHTACHVELQRPVTPTMP